MKKKEKKYFGELEVARDFLERGQRTYLQSIPNREPQLARVADAGFARQRCRPEHQLQQRESLGVDPTPHKVGCCSDHGLEGVERSDLDHHWTGWVVVGGGGCRW